MTLWCESCQFDDYDGAEEPCINCVVRKDEKPTEFLPKKPTKPQTNADRIRGMTDEELAHLLHTAEEHLFSGNLWNYEQWNKWLKATVEEVQDG